MTSTIGSNCGRRRGCSRAPLPPAQAALSNSRYCGSTAAPRPATWAGMPLGGARGSNSRTAPDIRLAAGRRLRFGFRHKRLGVARIAPSCGFAGAAPPRLQNSESVPGLRRQPVHPQRSPADNRLRRPPPARHQPAAGQTGMAGGRRVQHGFKLVLQRSGLRRWHGRGDDMPMCGTGSSAATDVGPASAAPPLRFPMSEAGAAAALLHGRISEKSSSDSRLAISSSARSCCRTSEISGGAGNSSACVSVNFARRRAALAHSATRFRAAAPDR